jgi:hypothetical protein
LAVVLPLIVKKVVKKQGKTFNNSNVHKVLHGINAKAKMR